MKPIEPGCLAVFLHSANSSSGTTVTVGKYIGNKEDIKQKRLWEVTPSLPYRELFSTKDVYFPFAPEDSLMRIDGYDDSQDKEETKDKLLENG